MFYRSMANAAESGLHPGRALEILVSGSPQISKDDLRGMLDRVNSGQPVSEAIRAYPGTFEAWQSDILAVGEETGRVDAMFKLIADLLEQRRTLIRGVLSGLAYPLFILHVAPLLVFAFKALTDGALAYAAAVLGFLLWFYIPAAVLVQAVRLDLISLASLPVFSSFPKAQFCMFLSMLIRAGVSIHRALPLAARASGIPMPIDMLIERGLTTTLRSFGVFSEEELGIIQVAEASGKLDDSLSRISVQRTEKWQGAIRSATTLAPPVIFLVVALVIGMKIASFWKGYFNTLNQFMR